MRLGLCTNAAQNAALLAGSPLDYLEENVQGFLCPLADEGRFLANLSAALTLGTPIAAANCFLPADLPCVGPQADPIRLRAYAGTAFRRARQAGIRCIVFGSGGSRRIPDGWSRARAEAQFTALLRDIAPLAANQGVVIALEPLNRGECNFITSLAEGATLVRAAGHPAVRLLADLYHMGVEGEPWSEIERHADLLAHVHVARVAGRAAPGPDDGLDEGYAALHRSGYGGDISLECGWGDLERELAPAQAWVRRRMAMADQALLPVLGLACQPAG
jgi:sugar phosphate isomerase/epimerase